MKNPYAYSNSDDHGGPKWHCTKCHTQPCKCATSSTNDKSCDYCGSVPCRCRIARKHPARTALNVEGSRYDEQNVVNPASTSALEDDREPAPSLCHMCNSQPFAYWDRGADTHEKTSLTLLWNCPRCDRGHCLFNEHYVSTSQACTAGSDVQKEVTIRISVSFSKDDMGPQRPTHVTFDFGDGNKVFYCDSILRASHHGNSPRMNTAPNNVAISAHSNTGASSNTRGPPPWVCRTCNASHCICGTHRADIYEKTALFS